MTARIVRRLIRSFDAAGVIGVFCVWRRTPLETPPAPDRTHAPFVPFNPMCRKLWWWIRAMRLIQGTGMHQINHEAPIHHAKRVS